MTDYIRFGLQTLLLFLILSGCSSDSVSVTEDFPLQQSWLFEADGSFLRLSVNEDVLVGRVSTLNYFSVIYLALDTEKGKLLWKQKMRNHVAYESDEQLLTNQHLLLTGNGLKAIDLISGKTEWTAGNSGDAGTIATTDGIVFVAYNSLVRAFDITTGQRLWSNNNSFPGVGFEVLYDKLTDRLVVAPHISDFTLLDPRRGKVIEKFDVQIDCQIIALRIHEGRLYCGSEAYDASTGDFLLDYDFSGENFTWYPPRDSHTILVSTASGTVQALDLISGDLIWEYRPQVNEGNNSGEVVSNIASLNAVGYAIASDATLRAIDLTTGQEIG